MYDYQVFRRPSDIFLDCRLKPEDLEETHKKVGGTYKCKKAPGSPYQKIITVRRQTPCHHHIFIIIDVVVVFLLLITINLAIIHDTERTRAVPEQQIRFI